MAEAALARVDVGISEELELAIDGLSGSWTAANADGQYFFNDPYTQLYVLNVSGGAINVTVAKQVDSITPGDGRFGELTVSDLVVAVADDDVSVFGIPVTQYTDSDGYAHISFSAAADVYVAAVRRK